MASAHGSSGSKERRNVIKQAPDEVGQRTGWDSFGNQFNIPKIECEEAEAFEAKALANLAAATPPCVVLLPDCGRGKTTPSGKKPKVYLAVMALKCVCGRAHKRVSFWWHDRERVYTTSCKACFREYAFKDGGKEIRLIGKSDKEFIPSASIPLDLNGGNVMSWRYNYEVHPCADLFPLLSGDEYRKLKNDIASKGLLEPIVLDGEMLLDGRNRLKACRELEIQPRTIQLSEITSKRRMTPAEYIWSENVLRRHLTDDQRAAIAHKWSDTEKEAGKERSRQNLKHGAERPDGAKAPTRGRQRKRLAERAQVTEHKIRQVERVAKEKPELLPKVAAGEMKLKDAEKVAVAIRDTAAVATQLPVLDTPEAAAAECIRSIRAAVRVYQDTVKIGERWKFSRLLANPLAELAAKLRTSQKPKTLDVDFVLVNPNHSDNS